MSSTILCSTGIITRSPDQTDHKAILEHAASLSAPGLELAVYEEWYGHLDDVVQDLGSADLSFPVVHADKAIGSRLGSEDTDEADEGLAVLETNCRLAAALKASTIVVHLWELPMADRAIERNLEHLTACIDTAEAYRLALAVETIPGFHATPLSNLKLALERDPRCLVTLDTEFLAFHGEVDEAIRADWLWADSRVRHVHLKDFDGRMRDGDVRRYLLPGEGRLDLQGFLAGLRERGYGQAITLEATARTPSGALDEGRLAEVAGVVQQLSGA